MPIDGHFFCSDVMNEMELRMAIIGYARVSTDGQSLQSQTEALHQAGAAKVYSESNRVRTLTGHG